MLALLQYVSPWFDTWIKFWKEKEYPININKTDLYFS